MKDHQLPLTYRAVRLADDGPILERLTIPKFLKDDEIFIRVIVAGICRSDLKEIQNSRAVRNDFGHEVVGYVEWCNPNLSFSQGDLVCFDPHVNIVRSTGFAEFMIAKGKPESLFSAFPRGLINISKERMLFCEPLACAIHAVKKIQEYLCIDRFEGLKIGILGAGNAGTLIGLLVKNLGGDIVIINRSKNRLSFLLERKIFSESELMLMNEGSHFYDAIVAATTFIDSNVLSVGLRKIKPEGLVLLFGGTQPDEKLSPLFIDFDRIRRQEELALIQFENKNVFIAGTYGAISEDFFEALRVLQDKQKEFPVEHLISSEVTLDNLCPLLKSLSNGETEFNGKIIVQISR